MYNNQYVEVNLKKKEERHVTVILLKKKLVDIDITSHYNKSQLGYNFKLV